MSWLFAFINYMPDLKVGAIQLQDLISLISGYGSVSEPLLPRKLGRFGSPELVCGLCWSCDPVGSSKPSEQSECLLHPGDLNFHNCSCCVIHVNMLGEATRRTDWALSDSLNILLYICGRFHADFRRTDCAPVDSHNPNLCSLLASDARLTS